MTEAERLLSEVPYQNPMKEQTMSPAERYLTKSQSDGENKEQTPISVSNSRSDGGVTFKIIAVVVFAILILVGTYFARVSGPPLLGYIIGAAAFIISPWIWNLRRT